MKLEIRIKAHQNKINFNKKNRKQAQAFVK